MSSVTQRQAAHPSIPYSLRLEHLGDCLLKLVTSVELYLLYPKEKENYLTKKRGEVLPCPLDIHLLMQYYFDIVFA